jgi:putative transport protein
VDNPLLLLIAIVVIGYPLGHLAIGGSSLGVAAVLFAGLAVGALSPDLKLPEVVYQLGLVLFVYTVGLSNGRAFFASFRRRDQRHALLTLGVLLLAAALAAAARAALGLSPALAAGMFAGSLTNTPALAGILQYLAGPAGDGGRGGLPGEPVAAYSVTYPLGVVATMLAIAAARRWWGVDYAAEAASAGAADGAPLLSRTIRITRPAATAETLGRLVERHGWDVVFGRLRHEGRLCLAGRATRLAVGDLVTAVGERAALDAATAALGEASAEQLELDRRDLDFRRIFVSAPQAVGRRVGDLHLTERFGAVATRIRRGDVDLLARDDAVLERGDRVRVVAHRENLAAVASFLGDSYRAASEIDVLTFSLGLALGLLAGLIPLPLPGGITLRLGLAGGPLVVALALGARERTGRLVWTLPYGANQTLRQLGLLLFLAGIGTRAGDAFVATVRAGGAVELLVSGAAITLTTALATLWVGHRLLALPLGLLAGILAGVQTQPAVLAFALEQAGDDRPNLGYAAVFPIAMIAKILLAQILLALWL